MSTVTHRSFADLSTMAKTDDKVGVAEPVLDSPIDSEVPAEVPAEPVKKTPAKAKK